MLSGHAHLYQRFSRRVDGHVIPYIVAGSGGFAATAPQEWVPAAPVTIGDHTLVVDPIVDFGYLTVAIDMTTVAKTLTVTFRSPNQTAAHDSVTVEL